MSVHRTTSLTLAALAAAAALAPAALAYPMGDYKGYMPFTRPVASQPTGLGEPKNEVPFTNPAPVLTPTAAPTGGGFDWTDAAIGAGAGIGLTLAALGGAAQGRSARATRTAH